MYIFTSAENKAIKCFSKFLDLFPNYMTFSIMFEEICILNSFKDIHAFYQHDFRIHDILHNFSPPEEKTLLSSPQAEILITSYP